MVKNKGKKKKYLESVWQTQKQFDYNLAIYGTY